jgi:uncharacterized membrane protein
VLFILIMALSTAPLMQDTYEESEARALTPREQIFASAAGFEEASSIIPGRCAMCHAREPSYDGIHRAPKNILLETPADIAKNARLIYIQAGVTNAMPPANVSYMEEPERLAIRKWYSTAAKELPFTMAAD